MKKLLTNFFASVLMAAALFAAGCFFVFSDSAVQVEYQMGQDNSIIKYSFIIIGIAVVLIIAMLVLNRRKNK